MENAFNFRCGYQGTAIRKTPMHPFVREETQAALDPVHSVSLRLQRSRPRPELGGIQLSRVRNLGRLSDQSEDRNDDL